MIAEPHLYASHDPVCAVNLDSSFRKEDWMHFRRRQLLRTLSFAFGSSFLLSGKQLGLAAHTTVSSKLSPSPAGTAVHDGIAGGMEMEKVTGNPIELWQPA